MFDTGFYNQNRSFKSGMEQAEGLRGALQPQQPNQDEADALKAIQGGANPQMVIAELQKKNPTAAASIARMLGLNTGAPSLADSFSLTAPRF